ncbi:MAG: HYR domain-containing protein, partial [Nitrosopumilus sp.]|nr:HYR domain-containing protein [Nitrosopumilus sp.]
LLLTINNPTPKNHDNFGASVSSTRNYDLLIGATVDNTGADNAGSAYLFDDVADGLLLTINNPTPKNHDNFGASVSSTRNNDLLIGALNDDTGAGKAGSVYLFDGVTGSLFLTNNNPSAENDDKFGTSIAFTPHNYMVVGEPRNLVSEPAGSVHLYGGHTDSILFTMNNPTPENGDKFGESIAYVQNGNVLIGAPNDNTGADEAGSVYLFDAIVDIDNDGIHDHIDDDEDYFNDSFNDGITDGVIVSRGDQFIKIIDEPDHFGVRIITDSSGGPTPADISICGGASQAFFAAANEVVGTCGSVTWEVISGEINGVIVSIDGETAEFSLKSGDNFYFDDKSFTLQSSEGNAEITLVGDDGTKIKVILSGGNLVSFDSETSIITADPSNTGDVTIIIDDKEITIKPGQTTAPTIIGPDDLTVEATALETPASDVLLGTPDVSGNVDPNPNVVNNEPSTYPLGLTEITWTVTDLTGNSAEDTQLVTLVDTTPPTLVTPDNVEITLEGVLTSVDVGIASAIDTVDSNPSITNDSPFDGFPIGETIVTWTATDFSGNSVLQTQLVTINAPQQGKQDVISELEILQTNANSKHTPIEIGKAIKDIQNSLDSELWVDQINLDPMKGEKVFKEEGDAVIRLLTILGHDDDDDDEKKSKETQEFQNQIQNLVDELVIFDRILAQHAIDRAIDEFGGDKKSDEEIDRANKEMTMAQKELDKDKPDKAIDRFEKAWKHAQKAMKHAENDDDDDDDDDENEDNENNDENDYNDD